MGRIRTLSIALALLAATGLLVSSMGMMSVAADRGVSVAVVDDDAAYVGYQTADLTVTDGERVDLVTVTNRFYGPVSVTNVSVDAEGVSFESLSTPSLGVGEEGVIGGTVVCDGTTTTSVEITVTVEGENVMATIYGDTITREFDVTCEPSVPDARFLSAGNFEMLDASAQTVEVDYWTAAAGGSSGERTFTNHSLEAFQTNRTLQSQVAGTPRVVAVSVPASDVTYYHPQFDPANGTIDSWVAGPATTERGGPTVFG